MGQKSETVGTPSAAAMCIGPVLDETRTSRCEITAITRRRGRSPMRIVTRSDPIRSKCEANSTSSGPPVTMILTSPRGTVAGTKAGYNFEHGAIRVKYRKPGCEAYYDPGDDILMIEISDSDGDLTVKCGRDAHLYWDDYCDVYIDAADVAINTINLKGTAGTQLYVCGEVGSVRNLKLKYGCIGDTGRYGPDFGLVNTSLELPTKIKILWGWATAPVLGVYEE